MQRPDYICIDMDGVLVDLHTPMIALFGDDPATYSEAQWAEVGEWGIGIPSVAGKFEEGHFWDKIKALGADWWANLPKLPWTDDLWNAALETGAAVTVLSTPAYFPERSRTPRSAPPSRWLLSRCRRRASCPKPRLGNVMRFRTSSLANRNMRVRRRAPGSSMTGRCIANAGNAKAGQSCP